MNKALFKKIIKRDGRVEDFDAGKITQALLKAGKATAEFDKEVARKLTIKVLNLASQIIKERIPMVEEIQDIVEEVLLASPYKKTAKAYIIYRDQHAKIREIASRFNVDLVDAYLNKADWQVRENSNMSFSLQGLNNYISSEVSKIYWLSKIYPSEIRDAHLNGDFHIHDLGVLSVYCVGWDLQDLLLEGFRGAEGKVESSPAKHFSSVLGQIVNFFYTLQGEAAGAQAFSNFDTLLAPFIYYDKLSYKEIKQALQEFMFNVNVPTRVGFQSPFTNITLDLNAPPYLTNSPAIIGGKLQDKTYKEFQKEQNLFNKALLEVMLEGDAKQRVFTFPIPTYNITKDFDCASSALSLLWEVTAKYGIPYFANFINSEMQPEDVRSMCLHQDEEVFVKINHNIHRIKIKDLVVRFKKEDYDNDGWVECDKTKNLEMLSLNPDTLKTEWVNVERFLKISDNKVVEITTEDGKFARFSTGHIIPVLTERGIENKRAEDLKEGDYLLNLKSSKRSLSKKYQKIEDLLLNENLAKILGYFIADGNYLFETRKNIKTYGMSRGLQFTFKYGEWNNVQLIKSLLKDELKCKVNEKKDSRYNTYYLYVYDASLSRKLYNAGFKKYGRLPQILFNSPASVIKSFLEYHFKGDGYERRKEIHLNDLDLSRDLVMLYTLVGTPVIYRLRKNSQVIYLQHSKSSVKNNGFTNSLMYERVPGFFAKSTYVVPGLTKDRMVGLPTIDKYNAGIVLSELIKRSDICVVRIKSIKKRMLDNPQEFYDVELSKNHLFVHSLGMITHNCCRLRIDNRKLEKRGGGLFGASPLTGSIGVVTINMPRLGFLSKNEDEFFGRLSRLMDLAKESLEIKRKILERFTENNLYPYMKFYLRNVKKRFNQYWKNHFSTIGLIGMNEACLNLFGGGIASNRGREFALKVLDFMRKKLIDFQIETGNNYNLEATPAEGASFRLAKIDKEKFPSIICANEKEFKKGAPPFYTNSVHLPVNYTDDIFEVLEHQDELQVKFNGGTVVHIYIGEKIENPEVIKNLVKKICFSFRLPYFTITPTFSICPSCGYLPSEIENCPKCNSVCEVYSRIVGYLRPVKQWNDGKRQEFKFRKTFNLEKC
jgi:ribonucleoside-triphosphate reductase